MSSASNPSILPLKNIPLSKENSASDYEDFQKEIKADVEKYFEEYNSIHKSHTERLDNFATAYTEEIQKVEELFNSMGDELDQFKNHIKELIEKQVKSETQNLSKFQNDLSSRLDQIEQQISTIHPSTSDSAVDEVREELIEGIKLLGKRVSKAIQDMNNKFNEFTQQSQNHINEEKLLQSQEIKERAQAVEPEFGNIKESDLLNVDDYEVVPKKSINKLTQLFKNQSESLKIFVEENKTKIKEFESLLKTYDEENAKLIAMLSEKTKKNFLFSVIGFCILVALLIIFQFIL